VVKVAPVKVTLVAGRAQVCPELCGSTPVTLNAYPLASTEQSVFVREGHELDPGADPEFAQDAAHVCFDGRFRGEDSRCDFGVTEPFGD
jgi:hypothetical protein